MSHESALQSIDDPRFKRLCEQIIAAMDRLQVPGVAVGVVHGDAEHIHGSHRRQS